MIGGIEEAAEKAKAIYAGEATMVFAPTSGGEIGIAPRRAPPELAINAVYDTRRHLLPKLQAFLGFLKARFGTKA